MGRARHGSNSARRLVIALTAVILLVVGARAGQQIAGSGETHPSITYTTAPGDTAASVASAFAIDPVELASRSKATGLTAPLTPGLRLTIDVSPLWSAVQAGERGTDTSLVEAAARRFGVEPALALAVAWQESRLDEEARSPTGAVGIMQVEPETSALAARDLHVPIDPYRPADNVLAGVFWLHALLASYGGDMAAALAAYYEGPGNLARQGYLPGTAEYVTHASQLRDALLTANPGLAGQR